MGWRAMEAAFILWLAALAVGVGPLVFVRRRTDPAARASRQSAVALAPSALPLVEAAVRTAAHAPVELYQYWTLFPFAIGVLVGFVALVASYLDAGPLALPAPWELLRVVHIVAWGCSGLMSFAMMATI